jgi:ubiquinone/menaquinone biosynthesis C-methylase UbiE
MTHHTDSTTASSTDDSHLGSVSAFRSNWVDRPESKRYHFWRAEPENQIQFAFQNHWRVFQQVMGDVRAGRALEVGCGRGSMGAFFADSGFDTHLLDTSEPVLHLAQQNFTADYLHSSPICGDALSLPYADSSFDVVVSIGLLEHFSDISQPLREQLRILRSGGIFLGYVVPERAISVQTLAIPVNLLLRLAYMIYQIVRGRTVQNGASIKKPLFRNSFAGRDYLAILQENGVQEMGSFGMFPVPLISHSYKFPFSCMAPPLERGVVWLWKQIMSMRGRAHDPWICAERWGLAFLVWAKK